MIVITGSGGLIGGEAARYFCSKGRDVVGIDNNMRAYFFGKDAGTKWNQDRLAGEYPKRFKAMTVDIRDADKINKIFGKYNRHISCVIHTAAQPSHDWAAREPQTDFTVNANGTPNLLEATRIPSLCPVWN